MKCEMYKNTIKGQSISDDEHVYSDLGTEVTMGNEHVSIKAESWSFSPAENVKVPWPYLGERKKVALDKRRQSRLSIVLVWPMRRNTMLDQCF